MVATDYFFTKFDNREGGRGSCSPLSVSQLSQSTPSTSYRQQVRAWMHAIATRCCDHLMGHEEKHALAAIDRRFDSPAGGGCLPPEMGTIAGDQLTTALPRAAGWPSIAGGGH
jgi:hypothetical protein